MTTRYKSWALYQGSDDWYTWKQGIRLCADTAQSLCCKLEGNTNDY